MPSQRIRGEVESINRIEESMGALFGQLARHSSMLVRDEIALAREEMRDKIRQSKVAALIMAISTILSVGAVMSLIAAVILALATVLTAWQAALIVGLILMVSGGVTGYLGWEKLRGDIATNRDRLAVSGAVPPSELPSNSMGGE